MKKAKVLIVHNYYQIPGGEDSVVANEKKMLEDNGHKVILYSRNNNEIKSFSKIQKLMLPVMTVFNPKTYKEVKAIIKNENIDVVHVHNTLNLVSPAVYYAAKKCKVPVVQTIHNFRMICPSGVLYRDGKICEDCINGGLKCALKHGCYRGSKLQTLLCVMSLKLHGFLGIYKKLNYICLTDFNKEKLLNFAEIDSKRVYIKPNFVDESEFNVPYSERKNQFVFVGRTEKLKGIDVLLKAWKLLGEYAPKLIICGKGELFDWCKDFIEENNLSNVELLGFVDNKEVKKIIAQSKALILPTQWYEGFPVVIAEAYASGTPVIGSNIGNTKSLIEENKTGEIFEFNSAEALADAVRRAEKNSTYNTSDSAKKYSASANYEMLKDIYSKVD